MVIQYKFYKANQLNKNQIKIKERNNHNFLINIEIYDINFKKYLMIVLLHKKYTNNNVNKWLYKPYKKLKT